MSHLEDPTTLALLSAFLDGELGATEERALVTRLEQDPALQDALDALAEQMATTHRVVAGLGNDLVGDLFVDYLRYPILRLLFLVHGKFISDLRS